MQNGRGMPCLCLALTPLASAAGARQQPQVPEEPGRGPQSAAEAQPQRSHGAPQQRALHRAVHAQGQPVQVQQRLGRLVEVQQRLGRLGESFGRGGSEFQGCRTCPEAAAGGSNQDAQPVQAWSICVISSRA